MKRIFSLLIVLILLAAAYSFFTNHLPKTAQVGGTHVTSTIPVNGKVILSLDQTAVVNETTIKPWAVTQDSRCPSDVRCIQAGKVTVAFTLMTPSGNSIHELAPGESVTTETLAITLDQVDPYPVSTKKIADGEYRFTFSVKQK